MTIFGRDPIKVAEAHRHVQELVADIREGEVYTATVVEVGFVCVLGRGVGWSTATYIYLRVDGCVSHGFVSVTRPFVLTHLLHPQSSNTR